MAWCAAAVAMTSWVPKIDRGSQIPAGFSVALPKYAEGMVPSGRLDQRCW
jgi:hypothetical protein